MATKGVFIQSVSEPTDKRRDGSLITGFDGKPRKYWQLTLVKRSGPGGVRTLEAARNFWLDDRDTIDRDVMLELMQAKEPVDLSADKEPFDVVKVDIHPRELRDASGDPIVDENGVVRQQITARVIVLPGESVKSALAATHNNPPAYLASEPLPGAAKEGNLLDAITEFHTNGAM